MTVKIVFFTRNGNKVLEARRFLDPLGIEVICPPDRNLLEGLDEIQNDDPMEVVREKLRQIAERLKQPVMVDDFSFHIVGLNGFPGPSTKYVIGTLGLERIQRLWLGKEAVMESYIGYSDGKSKNQIFVGRLRGRITEEPISTRAAIKVNSNAPLNSIFIPEGENRTLAEIFEQDPGFKNHRMRALEQFVSWLKQEEL